MAWYNISGVPCVFALDYNSVISLSGSRVALSNSPLEYLNTKGNILAITKEESLGWNVNGFIPDTNSGSLKYRTLKVAKTNLIFENPKSFPGSKKVTFILRTKLKSSSKFMNAIEGSDLNYGLSFTDDGSFTSYNNLWRFQYVSTEPFINLGITSKNRFSNFRSVFDTVVLRLDWGTNTGHLRTTYGSLSLPIAVLEDSRLFVKAGTFKVLGSGASSWELDADIVAYGMFDGYLTDLQVDACLSNIDSEFLVESGISKGFSDISGDFKLGVLPTRKEGITSLSLEYKKLVPEIFNSKALGSVVNSLPYLKASVTESLRNFYKNPGIHRESSKPLLVNKRLQKTTNLTGLITEEDIPISTKLYIYEKGSGLLVATTFSNKEGIYTFKDINPDLEYVITSFDRKYQYKSIIQDFNTK